MMAVVGHSFCATVFDQRTWLYHSILVTRRPATFIFPATQLIVVASYLWLFVEAMHQIVASASLNRRMPHPANS